MESQTEGQNQITINSFFKSQPHSGVHYEYHPWKKLHQKTHSQRLPNMLKNSIYQRDK